MAVLSAVVSNILGFSFHGTLSCSSQWSIPHHVLPFGSQMPLSEEIAACVAPHCWGCSISDCNQLKTAKEILGSVCFYHASTCRTFLFYFFYVRLNCFSDLLFGYSCVSFSTNMLSLQFCRLKQQCWLNQLHGLHLFCHIFKIPVWKQSLFLLLFMETTGKEFVWII